jgi:multidrug efflux system membrane fusion protein
MTEKIAMNEPKGIKDSASGVGTSAPRRAFRKVRLFYALGAIAALILGFVILYKASKSAAVDPPSGASAKMSETIPVLTATAILKSLPLEVRNIGNVEAYSVVNVIAQVGGQLTHVYFTQGQDVKSGDLLFQIDPRPYQALLGQAEANVVRDQSQIHSAQANLARDTAAAKQTEANLQKDSAQQNYADVEVGRYKQLVADGAVSQEQSDQIRTNSETAGATVLSDKAAVENAKAVINADKAAIAQAKASLAADQSAADNLRIQLGFTQIRSPVDGVTGALNVYQGNVVRANDTTPLVTINQIAPIYVTFSVPETNLDQIRQAQVSGTLKVRAYVDGNKQQPVEGRLSFIDNTVDKTTGTIKLRATFPNKDRLLWPGRFVDVVVTLPQPQENVVIPSRAVQSDQQGQSVYVVQPDNTVTFVPVEVQRTHGEFSVITKGLKVGDVVVIDGQLKLTPGAAVKVIDPTKDPTRAASASS